jgi:hypothetical protein
MSTGSAPKGNISGKVTYRGKLLRSGVVLFFLRRDIQRVGGSKIKSDGTYKLELFPVGEAIITVVDAPLEIPPRYENRSTTPLSYTVEYGPDNIFNINLEDE